MKKEINVQKKIRQKARGKEYKFLILLAIIIFIMGLLIGFEYGVSKTIEEITDIASRFIQIDEQLVSQAIYQYKNNIRTCYPNLTK